MGGGGEKGHFGVGWEKQQKQTTHTRWREMGGVRGTAAREAKRSRRQVLLLSSSLLLRGQRQMQCTQDRECVLSLSVCEFVQSSTLPYLSLITIHTQVLLGGWTSSSFFSSSSAHKRAPHTTHQNRHDHDPLLLLLVVVSHLPSAPSSFSSIHAPPPLPAPRPNTNKGGGGGGARSNGLRRPLYPVPGLLSHPPTHPPLSPFHIHINGKQSPRSFPLPPQPNSPTHPPTHPVECHGRRLLLPPPLHTGAHPRRDGMGNQEGENTRGNRTLLARHHHPTGKGRGGFTHPTHPPTHPTLAHRSAFEPPPSPPPTHPPPLPPL